MNNFVCIGLFLFVACQPNVKKNDPIEKSTDSDRLKIAYNVFHNPYMDDYEIFVMNLGGSGKKNIGQWEGVDWAYYAYRNKIYFVSDRDTVHSRYFLYEMDADGNNVRKISVVRLADSFMGTRKNGTEWIVKPHSLIDSVFYVVEANGEVVQKFDAGKPYHADPFFSPDGTEIVFRGALKKSKRKPDLLTNCTS